MRPKFALVIDESGLPQILRLSRSKTSKRNPSANSGYRTCARSKCSRSGSTDRVRGIADLRVSELRSQHAGLVSL